MRIYRVSVTGEWDEHQGFLFTSSRREADRERASARRDGFKAEIEVLTVKPTRKGILALLSEIASHPDNG